MTSIVPPARQEFNIAHHSGADVLGAAKRTGVPAKAGTHYSEVRTAEPWVPAFAGTPSLAHPRMISPPDHRRPYDEENRASGGHHGGTARQRRVELRGAGELGQGPGRECARRLRP